VIRSELGERYALAFEGMRMQTGGGTTILTGKVEDQPHLFGILERINGLGARAPKRRGPLGRRRPNRRRVL